MSLLKNVVLEASSHTQTKTVFRIPSAGKLIMPEIRLCNFGVSATANGDGSETFCYGQGIYALIKAVRLYSNNILIDQCQDCSRYMALQNLSGPTDAVFDIKQKTICSNVNLQDEYFTDKSGLKPVESKLLGLLNLQACLPFLSAVEALYDMPGELRVEIEYNTSKLIIFSENGNGHAGNFSFTVSQPTCVYTQEMNEEKVAMVAKEMPSSYSWFTWEREFVQGLPQEVKSVPRIRAFDNKFVGTLVVQKLKNNGEPHPLLGVGKSDALGNEIINFMLNGSKLLPFNGLDTHARATAKTAELLGTLAIPFNAWDKICAEGDNTMLEDLYALNGALSWSSVALNTVVNRLDMEVQFQDGEQPGEPCDIWVFAKVLKFAVKDAKGNWVVGYQANGSRM